MSKLSVLKNINVPNHLRKCQNLSIVTCDASSLCARKYNTNNGNSKSYWRGLQYAIGGGIGIAAVMNLGSHYRNSFKDSKSNVFMPFCVKAVDKPSPRSMFNFLADVVEKTSPAVVYIEIKARNLMLGNTFAISNGSGFIVKEDGLILTNAHVVNHFGYVIVKLYDGREFRGKIEAMDSSSDLATVRIQATNLPVIPLGKSSTLRPGEFVIAMGNPLTLSHTVTAGVVSSTLRLGSELGLHKKSDYIQTDAAITFGNSGGPLVNLDGEVIGINTMKVSEGISFAIPSDRAITFLESYEIQKGKENLISKTPKKQKHKFLGITMMTLTPAIIRDLKERNPDFPSVDHGVLVWRVMVGSPSCNQGIKPGDVITHVNGTAIHSSLDIHKFLEKEDVLDILVMRSDKRINFKVPLVETGMP